MGVKGRSGRTPKWIKYNWADECYDLRSQGYSLEDTANIINRNHPEMPQISRSTVHRCEKAKFKTETVKRPFILSEYWKVFNEISYKLDTLEGIESRIRTALKSYIRNLFKGLEPHIRTLQKDTPNALREECDKRINQLIIDISNLQCSECRQRIVKAILRKENGEDFDDLIGEAKSK
jgi:hypothetical protein